VPNPFSDKAGKGRKPSPFAVKAGLNGGEPAPKKDVARNRSTPKERAAAVRRADKAAQRERERRLANPNNPWVKTAYDVSSQVAKITAQLDDYSKQYTQQVKIQSRAKTVEDVNDAFDKGDRLMSTIINLSQQRRRLIGGASV